MPGININLIKSILALAGITGVNLTFDAANSRLIIDYYQAGKPKQSLLSFEQIEGFFNTSKKRAAQRTGDDRAEGG